MEEGATHPGNAGLEEEVPGRKLDLLDGVGLGRFCEAEGGHVAAAGPGNYSGTDARRADGGSDEESAGGPGEVGLDAKHHGRHGEAEGERGEREDFEALESGSEWTPIDDFVR